MQLVLGVWHELEWGQRRVTSLKKTNTHAFSPLAATEWIAPQLMVEFCTHLPYLHTGALCGLVLSRFVNIVTIAMSLYSQLLCPGKHYFLDVISMTSASYNLFPPISQWSLSLRNREWHIDIPFMDENSAVSYSLHADQSCLSKLMSIYCKEKLLWWVLSDVWIYEYSDVIMSHFNTMSNYLNNSTGFSPRAYDLSSHRLLTLIMMLGMVTYHSASLKSNCKGVGYYHNIHATMICSWVTLVITFFLQ